MYSFLLLGIRVKVRMSRVVIKVGTTAGTGPIQDPGVYGNHLKTVKRVNGLILGLIRDLHREEVCICVYICIYICVCDVYIWIYAYSELNYYRLYMLCVNMIYRYTQIQTCLYSHICICL
jgi:hypothetical protein